MRKKGEHVKGQGRSQSARKQVGRGHTASVQAAASKGFRSEWEKAVPGVPPGGREPQPERCRLPAVQQDPISKSRHYSCFVNSVNETTVVPPCEGHGLMG